MARSDSQKSFQKALYLGVFFVVVLIVANSLMKFLSHSGNLMHARLTGANDNFIELDTNEYANIRKKTAGFWQCDGIKNIECPFLSVSDRIEVKDNGIFWRVRRDMITLPSGNPVEFSTITNGYIQPFYKSKSKADSISFQVHFIGQVVIMGKDTCYVEHARMSDDPKKSVLPDILRTPQRQSGEVASDTAWDIVADGKMLRFDGRRYSTYDTSGGALFLFFPKGATRLVGRISIDRCRESMSLEQVAKQAIIDDFTPLSVPIRTQQDILEAANTYYRGIGAVSLARSVTRSGSGTVALSFSVTPQGTVVDPEIASAKPWNMRLNNALKKELGTWVFPKCSAQQSPLGVSFSFHY